MFRILKSVAIIFCVWLVILVVCLFANQAKAQVKHVILISIDSFNPGMYLDKDWPCPNLRYLVKNGTHADYLKSVFPSFTYPSHTAMVTGAFPARSKIRYNQPIGSKGEWYWYANAIKVPTLWQKLHENHLTSAAIMWPVTVGADIDHNLSELWNIDHPDDRITVSRQYANPIGWVNELEKNATGKLDSTNFNDNYMSLDENVGRIAAYVIQKYKPNFLALHVIGADDFGHEFGRDADSVKLAMATNDRVIGNVLEALDKAHLKDSTAIIVVGDHGMATIHEVMRQNLLIKNVPAQFVPAGGSCFLYRYQNTNGMSDQAITKAVTDSLGKMPADRRKLFRIIDRKELDKMGADSLVLRALSGTNGSGLVFSGATQATAITNHGPGTLIQQSKYDGVFYPTHGGHHGYDPDNADMHTGFIAYGTGIIKGGHIDHLAEPDIAVLISKLLGITFNTPDGHYVPGILNF